MELKYGVYRGQDDRIVPAVLLGTDKSGIHVMAYHDGSIGMDKGWYRYKGQRVVQFEVALEDECFFELPTHPASGPRP